MLNVRAECNNVTQVKIPLLASFYEEISTCLHLDRALMEIMKEVGKDNSTIKSYVIHDGLLYHVRKDISRICIPRVNNLQYRVIKLFYDGKMHGHFGITATYKAMSKYVYLIGMYGTISKYIKSCNTCQLNNNGMNNAKGLVHEQTEVNDRHTHLVMDFAGRFKQSADYSGMWFDQILIVVDEFSLRCFLIPTKTSFTSIQIAKVMFRYVFAYIGIPLTIRCDNEPKLVADVVKQLYELADCKITSVATNTPTSNALAESYVKIVKKYLAIFINYEKDSWVNLLPFAQHAINNRFHKGLGMSPIEADIGMQTRDFITTMLRTKNSNMNLHEFVKEQRHHAEVIRDRLFDHRMKTLVKHNSNTKT